MDFLKELTDGLEAAFPGATAELEFIEDHEVMAGMERVGGHLVWSGFSGLPHIERQRKLREFKNERLTTEEQLRLSAILTFTPEEMAGLLAA